MNFVRSETMDGAAMRRVYPFSAILAQEEMKLALLLNAVNPAIGGVVVRGQKGTAKSTAARGLRDLLPSLDDGRRPAFVDFPLGATEDMVIGSIDFEAAVRDGVLRFQPGLLARAHLGVLYIDEVNLLDDHLVDSILDAAESGENVVEREGQSLRHASRFILIGTMNPEEGELRPQLLDRFGLAVLIEGETDPALRVDLLKRREAFDAVPEVFLGNYRDAEADLARRITVARERLAEVMIPEHLVAFIAEICQRNHVAGHRADIVMERAARAFAAWDGRSDVTADDILKVAPMVLLHRMRAGTPDLPPPPPPEGDAPEDSGPDDESDQAPPPPPDPGDADREDGGDVPDEVQEVGASYSVRRLERQSVDQTLRTGSGRRSRSASKQGRYVKSTSRRDRNDLALDATIRAAAPYQISRREAAMQDLAVHIADSDIREKVRERRVGNFLLFVVDGSGSMGARRRMVETKVAMVLFRGREAEVVLPLTNSVDRAAKMLADLPIGGRTPLSSGLAEAAGVLRRVLGKEPTIMPLVIVMTDGRANAGLGDAPPHEEALRAAAGLRDRYPSAQFVVVDTEPKGVIRLGLAEKLSVALGAAYFKTEDLRAEDLVSIAKEHQAW